MRVLMIDDLRNPKDLKNPFLKGPLEDLDITIARTGEEGLKLLETGEWDALLLDHDLGSGISGYDVAKWLEINPQKTPKRVFLVTNNPAGGLKMKLALDKMTKDGVVALAGWVTKTHVTIFR